MEIDALAEFDLKMPGNWIAGDDRDWAGDTLLVFSLLEAEYERAIAAFALFEPLISEYVHERIHTQLKKYERSLNSIYAREFVLSLDSVCKLLNTLARDLNPPAAVQLLIAEYAHLFGYLKHIRDSVAHIEDRGRGLDRRRRRIQVPVLVLGGFNERRFEFTAEDGNCYSIDITRETALSARNILQAIINEYSWE
ncbi:MAG: hypothetical protein PHQ05_14010 [Sterolibacterium sp.]|nr:hypothetical protein [Sterolibacterium sp.]